MNHKKTIVLGITGGIAAIKAPELITYLINHDIAVIPIMTENACKIIDKKLVENAAGKKVITSLFEKSFNAKKILENWVIDHIHIADAADLVLIAPATANIIGKLANGIADDFLTTTLLATTAPIVLCPSMNVHMWENNIVQDNLKKLQEYGMTIIPPESGMLACGYEGMGRLPEIKKIGNEVLQLLLKKKILKGKTILVTAGGTMEKIDDVRYITNRSSGKMGVALADACYEYGARIILLKAKNAVSSRYHLEEYTFETADDLLKLLKQHIQQSDICFHAAAVSDFTVSASVGKISSDKKISLNLIPRKKLYTSLKKINPSVFLITFKAEWQPSKKALLEKMRATMKKNNIDVIIANDVGKEGRGFDTNTNEVTIVKKDGTVHEIGLTSKQDLARKIIEYLF